MRSLLAGLIGAGRAVRPARVLILLLAALLAGLAGDWFRPAARLVFPRPLPSFHVFPPAP